MLGCSNVVSNLLTKLTTFQTRTPQGAPTSSTLVNLSLIPLHDDIATLCKQNKLIWSFYVDDITISGQEAQKYIEPIIKLIQKYGHAIKQKKLKIMKSNEAQRVTGLIVNKGVSIPREYLQNVRSEIIRLASKKTIFEFEFQKIYGQINHIKNICPLRGMSVDKFAKRLLPTSIIKTDHRKEQITRVCKNTHIHKHQFAY